MEGSNGKDLIYNTGSNVQIQGHGGNDMIENLSAANVYINAGEGNDTIDNEATSATIFAGSGDDVVVNYDADNVYINAGEGDNVIANFLLYEIIQVEGKDMLNNYHENTTIESGAGNDLIYNDGGYYLSVISGAGNDTVFNNHGYYPTITTGAGNDSIVISRGHYEYINAGEGNDTIIGTIRGGWAMGGHATLDAGAGDDYIDTGYSNDSSIYAGTGNDTIKTTGVNSTVNAGAGNNFIKITTPEESGEVGEYIVLSGNTTVEGFKTGFGTSTDTVYIDAEAPAVDFTSSGLTFYSQTDSLTLSDIHSTAAVNLYYRANANPSVSAAKSVFIAENDWYDVERGEAMYYVGTSKTTNHGVDFSAITHDLNVTLETDYLSAEATNWVNNVGSIKGGAGNTTITGSSGNDTIIAGLGNTSLRGKLGDDYLEGGTGQDTFIYALGDGFDTIQNAGAGDEIFLSDITVDQILSANIDAQSVVLNFEDGGSIKVVGSGEIYQLATGAKYSPDRENLTFNAL